MRDNFYFLVMFDAVLLSRDSANSGQDVSILFWEDRFLYGSYFYGSACEEVIKVSVRDNQVIDLLRTGKIYYN